jgi:UDP-N-acetylmuramyl tripeptide synthase
MFSFVKANAKPEFPVIKTLPTTASTKYKIGDALILSGGGLVKATGTTKPEYIAAANYSAPATGMEPLPAYLIAPGMEWETTFAADATAVTEGTKVTIHTDGAQVTATATSGVAQILKKHGTGAAGTKVTVTF